jgi:hypothetical protein
MKILGVMATFIVALWVATFSSWGAEKCTHIRVELNEASVSLPREIVLLWTKGGPPTTVPVEEGCFRLPEKLQHARSIDVVFRVGGDRIHLRGIEPSAFGIGWNLKLRDNATTGPFAALKGVSAREICVLGSEFRIRRNSANSATDGTFPNSSRVPHSSPVLA